MIEFQNYDDSFSGCHMKLYKELLNFLAVMSQKSEVFKNSFHNHRKFQEYGSKHFFDRSNLEKECHTNYNLKNKHAKD